MIGKARMLTAEHAEAIYAEVAKNNADVVAGMTPKQVQFVAAVAQQCVLAFCAVNKIKMSQDSYTLGPAQNYRQKPQLVTARMAEAAAKVEKADEPNS